MENGEDECADQKSKSISVRAFQYAVRIVKLCQHLDATPGVSRVLASQLLRSGTSIGANIEEGQGAQSKADFICKYTIALKEARESAYWIRLLIAVELIQPKRLKELEIETLELASMIGKAIVTARNRK